MRNRCSVFAPTCFLVVTACGVGITTPPDHPNVSGTWSISAQGFPGRTTGADGSCTFEAITIHLTRDGDAFLGDQYRGDHSGVRIECTGLSEAIAAETGLTDGVISMAADTMSAVVGQFCIGIGDPSCDPEIEVSIEIGAISFLGELSSHGASMSGGLVMITRDTIRISGTWSAAH